MISCLFDRARRLARLRSRHFVFSRFMERSTVAFPLGSERSVSTQKELRLVSSKIDRVLRRLSSREDAACFAIVSNRLSPKYLLLPHTILFHFRSSPPPASIKTRLSTRMCKCRLIFSAQGRRVLERFSQERAINHCLFRPMKSYLCFPSVGGGAVASDQTFQAHRSRGSHRAVVAAEPFRGMDFCTGSVAISN